MLSIRAGSLKSLYNGTFSNNEIKEIITWSGLDVNIKEFDLLNRILPILEKDDPSLEEDNDVYEFRDQTGYIENFLCDGRVKINGKFDKEKISRKLSIAAMMKSDELKIYGSKIKLDVTDKCNKYGFTSLDSTINLTEFMEYMYTRYLKMIKVNNAISKVTETIDLKPKYNFNTPGLSCEKYVIDDLKASGYDIVPCDRLYKEIGGLKLGGRPDGYIKNLDSYLEIKYNVHNKPSFQICCYSIITGKDVLVAYYNNGNIITELHTASDLKVFWENKQKTIYRNARRLYRLLDVSTISEFRHLEHILQKKIITTD